MSISFSHVCESNASEFIQPVRNDHEITMKLLTTAVCSLKCEMTVLLTLLFLVSQSNTETECEAADEMILKCKFSKNMESTETDFLIYFYPDDGKTELLGDCSWNNHQPECIFQDGVQFKQPVSDIAVISLPPRFVNTPGTYKCIPDGDNSDNSKACQVRKSNKEREESQNKSEKGVQLRKPVNSLPKNHHVEKGADTSNSSIIGAVLGALTVIIIMVLLIVVLYKKFWKKNFPSTKAESSLSLDNEILSGSTENKTTDKGVDTTLSSGSQPVPLQQVSSATGYDEKPLLQSENNENVAIRDPTPTDKYSDSFTSPLELSNRICEGFMRESVHSSDRF